MHGHELGLEYELEFENSNKRNEFSSIFTIIFIYNMLCTSLIEKNLWNWCFSEKVMILRWNLTIDSEHKFEMNIAHNMFD